MKESYKKILAACCLSAFTLVAGASVADEIQKDIYPDFTGKKSVDTRVSQAQKSVDRNNLIKAYKKEGTRADETSIEGGWIFQLGDYYAGSDVSYYQEFEATLSDGVVTFANLTDYELPVKAIYDEATGNLTFTAQYVTNAINYLFELYVFQQPFIYDWVTERPVFEDVNAQFVTEYGGYIVFPTDFGIQWMAMDNKNPQIAEAVATIGILDLENAVKSDLSDSTESPYWKDAGKATLIDGWVLPGLGIDQNLPENQYEVPLQQSILDPNIVRLVNPYKVGPAAEFNESVRSGFITLDLSNPEFVLVNPDISEAGFANRNLGITRMWCYDQLQYYHLRYSLDYDNVIYVFPELPYTKFKNGVVTLGTGIDSYKDTIYDANYGTQWNFYGGNAWFNDNGTRADMTTKIILPDSFGGVEGIIDDQSSLPIELYNLQGQKVKNPERGTIVIKKQGSKTTKHYVR